MTESQAERARRNRPRPVPDPIRGTPQALVPVAEELIGDSPTAAPKPAWVMAESAAIAILRRHYGWSNVVQGHLVKIRRETQEIGGPVLPGEVRQEVA